MNHKPLIVKPGTTISLKDYDPNYTGEFKDRTEAQVKLQTDVERLGAYQNVLYAQNTYALLLIFQAMDAAGKDSTIKHVMSGVNPQGCQVFSFKAPSTEELDHDYLWRSFKALPERGRIGIFNRSYYEEVLAVRVHPELLAAQQLPHLPKGDPCGVGKAARIWQQRFEEINNFEKYLDNNGVVVLKFFLNVSKEEQKKRFLERINIPEKNWKFSLGDLQVRKFWDDYMRAYEDALSHTSTNHAPWHVIPADHKWFTRLAVADIVCAKLKELNLQYPQMNPGHLQELSQAKALLESEA